MRQYLFRLSILICFSILTNSLFAQTWETYIATPSQAAYGPIFRFVHEFSNGEIIAAGQKYITKVNEYGDTIYNKELPLLSTNKYSVVYPFEEIMLTPDIWSGVITSDGNVALIGQATTYIMDSVYNPHQAGAIVLVKIDTDGDTLWTKILNSLEQLDWSNHYANTSMHGFDIRENLDGSLVIVGGHNTSAVAYGFTFIHTDANGEIINQTYITRDTFSIIGRSIQPMGNGDYMALADGGGPLYDFTLLRLGAMGDTIWTKQFELPPPDTTFGSSGFPKKIRKTSDGNYVVVGHIGETPTWTGIPPYYYEDGRYDIGIVKVDSQGTILWDVVYGGNEGMDGLHDIQQTTDGGFISVGHYVTDSAYRFHIVKLSALGDTVWTKNIEPDAHPQHTGILHAIEVTNDGGYLVVGDNYIMKLDSLGDTNIINSFDAVSSSLLVFEPYPNPSYGIFNLASNYDGKIDVTIISIGSQILGNYQNLIPPYSIDCSNLHSGMYFLKIQIGTEFIIKPFVLN